MLNFKHLLYFFRPDFGAGERGRPHDVPADVAVPAGAAEGAGEGRLEGAPAAQGTGGSNAAVNCWL